MLQFENCNITEHLLNPHCVTLYFWAGQMIKIGLLYGILVVSLAAAAQEIPQPLHTIDLSSLTPPGSASNVDATVTFVTDHILAVGMCYRSTCNLQTFDLSDGHPHQIGQINGIDHFRAIFRGGDGRVLVAGVKSGGEKGRFYSTRICVHLSGFQQPPVFPPQEKKFQRAKEDC